MEHKTLARVAFGLAAMGSLILRAAGAADSGLLDAVRGDDTRAARSLLKAGADPNTRDDIGATALMHAAAFSSPDCLRVQLVYGNQNWGTNVRGVAPSSHVEGLEGRARSHVHGRRRGAGPRGVRARQTIAD